MIQAHETEMAGATGATASTGLPGTHRRVHVAELATHVGETVTVAGWVRTLRLQRVMQFALVRDHTGTVQAVHRRGGETDALERELDGLTVESAVRVTGRVVANPAVRLGGLELLAESVEVLGRAEPKLPIDEHTGSEQRQDWRFLDVRRRPEGRLALAVQSTLEQGLREFALAEGCTELHTPKLMGTASESGAEAFEVGYFGGRAYLAQSPQFYKQAAVAAGIDRVFEVGPAFRAEPSYTSRHATEFTGVDVELGWIAGVGEVMDFEERMLRHALARVAERHGAEIRERFDGAAPEVPATPFPRVTLAEAVALLRAEGWDPEAVRTDLDPDGERRLAALVRERTGHDFVFVTHYPAAIRPFYHARSAEHPELTLSYDLLWRGLEITTGAQREHRHDVLLAQAAEHGLRPEPMRSYLDMFRFGVPPHGGFGLGLARVLMVLLGLDSIREAVFLFRGPNRLTP